MQTATEWRIDASGTSDMVTHLSDSFRYHVRIRKRLNKTSDKLIYIPAVSSPFLNRILTNHKTHWAGVNEVGGNAFH